MRIKQILASSVGKKLGMALTGIGLYGFLAGHLAGNLLLFKGDDGAAFNAYSDFLTSHPLLIPIELILLGIFVAHIAFAISVSRDNRRARPVGYHKTKSSGGRNLASYTMIYSGLLILVFVAIHLKTFKYTDPGEGTLYDLVVDTLQQPLYAVWYVACMVILGFHLWHAFQSALQTLGLNGPKLRSTGGLISVAIAGGFCAIPVILFFSR